MRCGSQMRDVSEPIIMRYMRMFLHIHGSEIAIKEESGVRIDAVKRYSTCSNEYM